MMRLLLAAGLLFVLGLGLGLAQTRPPVVLPAAMSGTPDPASTEIPHETIAVVYVDSEENPTGVGAAKNLLDGDHGTVWHSKYFPAADPLPHTLIFDLGGIYKVDGWQYLPRQDGSINGTITAFFLYLAADYHPDMPEEAWTLVAAGQLAKTPEMKTVRFAPTQARYARVMALRDASGHQWSSGAEMGFWGVLVQKLARIEIAWDAPQEMQGLTGYLVYRRPGPCATPGGADVQLTSQPLTPAQLTYTDTGPPPPPQCYRVRAVYTCEQACAGEAGQVEATAPAN